MYSFYVTAKFIAVVSAILALCVGKQQDVKSLYDTYEACAACYDQAAIDPGSLYEFGRCSDNYNFSDASNLLWKSQAFDQRFVASAADQLVTLGALTLVIVILMQMGIALVVMTRDTIPDGDDFLLFVLRVTCFDSIFATLAMFGYLGLHKQDALTPWTQPCYVSLFSKAEYVAWESLLIVYFVIFAIASTRRDRFPKVVLYATVSEFVLFVACMIFIQVKAIINFVKHGRDSSTLALNTIIFSNVIEAPAVLYGVRWLPELGERFSRIFS